MKIWEGIEREKRKGRKKNEDIKEEEGVQPLPPMNFCIHPCW
jgi:hypothetical protein